MALILPEEVVDHIDHFAGIDIDQHNIVVISHPTIWAIDFRQAVRPGIVDVVTRAEEQAIEIEADAQPVVAMRAVRRVIAAKAEDAAMRAAIVTPAIPAAVAPCLAVPATILTALCPTFGTATISHAVAIATTHTAVAATVVPAIITPITALNPAVCTPFSPAFSPAVRPTISPTVAATFDAVRAAITATFDPICAAITTALNPIGSAI